MPDPLDMIAEVVAGHRLWGRGSAHNPAAFCGMSGCDWERPWPGVEAVEVAHARHVAEVIRDALAPERVEWSLHQGGTSTSSDPDALRHTRAVGGVTLRRVDISDEVTALVITGSGGRPPMVTLTVHSPELVIEAAEAAVVETNDRG